MSIHGKAPAAEMAAPPTVAAVRPQKNSSEVSAEEIARRAVVAASRQQKKRQREEQQAVVANAPATTPEFIPKSNTSFRRMIPVRSHASAPCAVGSTFTVMTYNILAQCLCRRELFPYCKKDHLKTKSRFPTLMREITETTRPDVACLQEVDNFDSTVAPALRAAGYDWEYLRKTPEKQDGHGLCIAWRRNKFVKHLYRAIHYDDHPLTHPTPVTPETRNAGQIIALKFVEDASASDPAKASGILISNTHLFWRPTARYEKLRQAWVLINEMMVTRKDLNRAGPTVWPMFMCGDWNSTPDDGVYKTLTKQALSSTHHESLEPGQYVPRVRENEEPIAGSQPVNPAPLSRILEDFSTLPRLRSAYATYRENGGEPLFTNYAIWRGTLDYIFVCEPQAGVESQKSMVNFARVLELPDAADVEPGLPNGDFASDHGAFSQNIIACLWNVLTESFHSLLDG
ncbi:hypothetical protein HDU86_001728 [Geranomyces michiganensis]|nr:hypothetical protein HDU86_001728 [Geranomyces michiganensis]